MALNGDLSRRFITEEPVKASYCYIAKCEESGKTELVGSSTVAISSLMRERKAM